MGLLSPLLILISKEKMLLLNVINVDIDNILKFHSDKIYKYQVHVIINNNNKNKIVDKIHIKLLNKNLLLSILKF